jgi:hypothetical protein
MSNKCVSLLICQSQDEDSLDLRRCLNFSE